MIWHWFWYSFTGAGNEPGGGYGFWSGFGGSWLLGYLGLGALYVWHHNCHVHRCWRLSRRKVGDYAVCRRHHPDGKITAEHVAGEHTRRWRRPVSGL